jgi:uncharacterized protein YhaN
MKTTMEAEHMILDTAENSQEMKEGLRKLTKNSTAKGNVFQIIRERTQNKALKTKAYAVFQTRTKRTNQQKCSERDERLSSQVGTRSVD